MRLVFDTLPAVPADRGLGHSGGVWGHLERRVDEFRHGSGLPVDLLMNVADGVVPSDGARVDALVHILEEALANIERHSYAQTVRIRIAVDPPPQVTLYMVVSDDGIGTTAEAMAHVPGGGLARMHRRAEGLGGRLAVDSQVGRGTQLRLILPLTANA